jgi:tetratricopeptide (TPR) repeat protein
VDPTAASRLVEALFPDGGAQLFADAGMTGWWGEALGAMPPDWLIVSGSDAERGETLLVNLREHLQGYGNLRAAYALTRELVRLRSLRLGPAHPETLTEVAAFGALLDRANKLEEAGRFLERAYEGLSAIGGGRDPRLAVACQLFALHQLRRGQPIRAETLLEQALGILRESAPEQTGYVAAQLGELKVRRGVTEDALPFLWEAWERYRESYGTKDPRTVTRGRTIAVILGSLGRDAEAIPVLRGLYDAAVANNDAENRAAIGFQLGSALETTGRGEEALRLVDESVRWTRTAGTEDEPHPELASRITAWSRMILRRGRPVEAEGLLLEALEIERWHHGEDSPEVALRYAQLGHLVAQTGRRDEALGWLEPAAKLLRSALGDEAWQTKFAVEQLVDLWIATASDLVAGRDQVGARGLLMPARQIAAKVLGPRHRTIEAIDKFNLT